MWERLRASGGPLHGAIRVPGDKSISHRAAMVAALARGPSTLRGFLCAGDTDATLRALGAVGIRCDRSDDSVRVHGVGNDPWRSPDDTVDLENAGTAMRLLAGLFAGRGLTADLAGDRSLSRRPMARVVDPLRAMGACIEATDGHAPLRLRGGRLHGIEYRVPVASAQVRSALILAGTHADGETRVTTPAPVRDHLERLLLAFGVSVDHDAHGAAVGRVDWDAIVGHNIEVPGDPSAAAFFAVGAAIVPGSEITITGICANPTRTGFVDVLRRMGAEVDWSELSERGGEPIGDLHVRGRRLHATRIGPEEVPGMIDELPVLAVAAACADGRSEVRGAGELRAKESDRIGSIVGMLGALGISARAREDGFTVDGGILREGEVDAHGDHRIAMAAAIAAVRAGGTIDIRGGGSLVTSFPRFAAVAGLAGLEVTGS